MDRLKPILPTGSLTLRFKAARFTRYLLKLTGGEAHKIAKEAMS